MKTNKQKKIKSLIVSSGVVAGVSFTISAIFFLFGFTNIVLTTRDDPLFKFFLGMAITLIIVFLIALIFLGYGIKLNKKMMINDEEVKLLEENLVHSNDLGNTNKPFLQENFDNNAYPITNESNLTIETTQEFENDHLVIREKIIDIPEDQKVVLRTYLKPGQYIPKGYMYDENIGRLVKVDNYNDVVVEQPETNIENNHV